MTRLQDDWKEYRQLILAELKRLSDGIDAVRLKVDLLHSSDIGDLKAKIAVMQTELNLKAGLWGAAAAMIPSAIAVTYVLMRG